MVSTVKTKTPSQLSHSYITLELSEKLEVLHAFIKSHLNSKILVFMSSCKQVDPMLVEQRILLSANWCDLRNLTPFRYLK